MVYFQNVQQINFFPFFVVTKMFFFIGFVYPLTFVVFSRSILTIGTIRNNLFGRVALLLPVQFDCNGILTRGQQNMLKITTFIDLFS